MVTKASRPAERQFVIQQELVRFGSVSVENLSSRLQVSVATIRRDLDTLEEQGFVKRTHGGAIIEAPHGAHQAFALREQLNSGAKSSIATEALEFVKDGMAIFMNDGSTMYALARELVAATKEITVITSGINISTCLSECEAISTYLLGGQVRHQTLSTCGTYTEQMLRAFNVDVAILAADAISVDSGLTYNYPADSEIARLMSENASKTIVLVTAEKVGARDHITSLPIDKIDVIVTDCDDEEALSPIRGIGLEVVNIQVESSLGG